MYILENTMLKKIIIGLGLTTSILMFSGCIADKENSTKRAVDGGAKYEVKDGKYTSYWVNKQKVEKFNKGRIATQTEISAWNIDVMPDGTGLPMYDTKHGKILLDESGKKIIAEGSVELGAELYDAQCVMCHGDFGIGGKGYPTLSGGDMKSLTNQLQNPADAVPTEEPPRKTIGNYWPYASTLC